MTYDLLINNRFDNNWKVYKGLKNLSIALSISEKEVKNNSSFVFIRKVTSCFGPDVWKHFSLKTPIYSRLNYVEFSTNIYLLSKFKLYKDNL